MFFFFRCQRQPSSYCAKWRNTVAKPHFETSFNSLFIWEDSSLSRVRYGVKWFSLSLKDFTFCPDETFGCNVTFERNETHPLACMHRISVTQPMSLRRRTANLFLWRDELSAYFCVAFNFQNTPRTFPEAVEITARRRGEKRESGDKR